MKKLFSREEIEEAVKRLAASIERDFEGEGIVFVCLLKGSFMFTSDLIRHVKNPSRVVFMRVSSYGTGTRSAGEVSVTMGLEEEIEGENVIIVEDIIDSGHTLKHVKEILGRSNPKSLKICSLLDKKARREVEMEGDYVGFVMSDGFVVGYGIDYAEQYRNLPDIYVIDEETEQ